MTVAWLEIIIIAIGMLVAPFTMWALKGVRESILNQVILILNEHYSSLENLIDHNKDRMDKLETRLKHRAEIASIKYNEILHQLNDVQSYLENTNGYRRRRTALPINPKDIDKDTMRDSDDITMGF